MLSIDFYLLVFVHMWHCVLRMSEDIVIEHLIELISHNPCIWDKTCEGYSRTSDLSDVWRKLCGELNMHFDKLHEKEKENYRKSKS